jgi:hypothetical protein
MYILFFGRSLRVISGEVNLQRLQQAQLLGRQLL